MPAPHMWESVQAEVSDWADALPDQLAQDIIGEHRPWEPPISHDDQLNYHLEHLYPPELGGQFDSSYLAKVMTTSTKDEQKTLAQALDRHVLQKAEQQPNGTMPTYTPPPNRQPRPPRRY